jgi:mycothiol synthase
MVGELTPVRVDPLTADRDFWTRYHELRRARHSELHPDDPVTPDEVEEAGMKKPSPFDRVDYFEMSRDGAMISLLWAETPTPANPEYATNKHLVWAEAYVRKDERRKGVATSWLPVLDSLMAEHGSTVVGMSTTQPSGHGFLRWLGAEPKLTDIESRLKLAEVDWQMMRRWVDEGAKRSPQTRLEVYDGRMPDAMLPEFAVRRTELLNTIPFEDLDIGDIVVTPEKIRHQYERMEATGEIPHEVLTREPDGTISGMTDISAHLHKPTILEQQFTGVRPDARGRGLGKWIKAAMLLHIRELYPRAEWITTENAHSNGPMLKINRALGFKAYREAVEYQVTRDQIASKLKART